MERHGPRRGGGKRVAFTLAEVLITLGIIGVVAAITLPTLIQNYQKQVLVTQLKKVVNTLENNSRKILADEGVDSLKDTPLYSADGSISDGAHDFKLNKDYFEKHYKLIPLSETTEYAKFIKSIKNSIGGGIDEINNYYSSDGACISVSSYIGNSSLGPEFLIDINCDKRPNKVGYDRFYISILENGLIALNNNGLEAADCSSEFLDELEENAAMQLIFGGDACFKRIVQDGWKINY